ncbi:MAG: ATP-binding protein [Armatimonadota bacterium]|nr:ATP-binding protein [Armatimonadota bacterium]
MITKIKWKLTATYLAVIFVSMTVIGLYLSYSMEKQTVGELHERLRSHLSLATEMVGGYLNLHPDKPSVDPICADLGQKLRARIVVRDLNGNILGDSSKFQTTEEPLQRNEKRLHNSAACRLCHAEARELLRAAETGDVFVKNRKTATIEISTSLFGVRHSTGRTRRIILSGLIVTTLIAALISQRLAGSIANPISKMNRMAKKIAEGEFDQQVSIDSHDEVGEFAQSFNQMAQKVREIMDAMIEDKDKMETILTTMADGIIVTDETGRIVLFNPASEQVFQIDSGEVIGRFVDQANLHPDIGAMVKETLETGNLVRRETQVSESPNITLSAHSAPIKDATGAMRGAVVGLRDVTEILQQEKSQRDFVANVSHELRTPITAVRSTAEALLSGAKNDPALLEKFLGSLVKESERLSLLIDDLLEIAKLDSGRCIVKQRKMLLLETVDRIVGYLKPQSEDQSLTVNTDIPKDIMAYADPEQIGRALINLLDNAIKYTPPGGTVTITAKQDGDWISVHVKDTGIGISKDEIRRIFERFYRVDKARSRQLGGTGLGLSIVKDIVTAHGGSITVHSQLDKGSVFTFTIPRWTPGTPDSTKA